MYSTAGAPVDAPAATGIPICIKCAVADKVVTTFGKKSIYLRYCPYPPVSTEAIRTLGERPSTPAKLLDSPFCAYALSACSHSRHKQSVPVIFTGVSLCKSRQYRLQSCIFLAVCHCSGQLRQLFRQMFAKACGNNLIQESSRYVCKTLVQKNVAFANKMQCIKEIHFIELNVSRWNAPSQECRGWENAA